MNHANKDHDTTTEDHTWATFRLERELFALPVEDVQEVLIEQPLTPVPLAPPHIVGLLNLRGQIMPAIDLRRQLGFAPSSERSNNSLLVLKAPQGVVSIVVDEIGDVLELAGADWRSPPETLGDRHKELVAAIQPISGDVVLALRLSAIAAADAQERKGGG